MKRSHDLWIKKEAEIYTIGMTPELQDEVGEIGFAALAECGPIEVDGELADLEASKMVVAVPSPLKGVIVERNSEVEERPSLLNSTKTSENCLVKMTAVDETFFNQLPNN